MSIILEQCEICDKLIECNDHSIELGFVCCDSCYNPLWSVLITAEGHLETIVGVIACS